MVEPRVPAMASLGPRLPLISSLFAPLLASIVALLPSCAAGPHDRADPIDVDVEAAALPGPLSAEATWRARWAAELKDRHDASERSSFFGARGLSIHYQVHRASGGGGGGADSVVVVLPGRTEPADKYAEVAVDLVGRGFTVVVLDHRGQGLSERMLDNPFKGHVEAFADYVDDVRALMDGPVRGLGAGRVFLLAHSMGGAIATLYADAYPEGLAGMVLSAPMLEIATGGIPAPLAASVGFTVCSSSSGEGYATGGDYEEETDFEASRTTSSYERWRWKNELFRERPALRMGGATYRWLCEALAASSAAQRLGPRARVRTLLLQATNDSHVLPGGQERYCEDSGLCQLSRVDDGKHELLMERDEVRAQALGRAIKFMEALR